MDIGQDRSGSNPFSWLGKSHCPSEFQFLHGKNRDESNYHSGSMGK